MNGLRNQTIVLSFFFFLAASILSCGMQGSLPGHEGSFIEAHKLSRCSSEDLAALRHVGS